MTPKIGIDFGKGSCAKSKCYSVLCASNWTRGAVVPDALLVHHSWIAADMSRCFLLVEADDVTLLQRWVVEWADLVEFEIVPVATNKDIVEALSGHL
ncbi:DUF3303 family protein [Mesorhizobium sp. M6A.T.Ce.TU.002.03.1.1]|uniref:DUF3303 domain-containing protein n=1 Tax=Mesorhizobium sp. M6A.T.Ce.TU.002.03.1.1 TaxID=2496782 RepID=UPI001FDFD4DB|nr:DUF3303 family protein [Mesorhizobium sp. M6A.T.Ce.TU.002.03.1.1]